MIRYFANPIKAALAFMLGRRDFGMIVTPKQGNRLPVGVTWIADNGCGPGKNGVGLGYPGDDAYLAWLAKMSDRRADCVCATAPDVVGDAEATLARSRPMFSRIRALGFKVALVLQDGAELQDLPWSEFDAVFVGGSTEWKLGAAAAALVAEAKARGKFVHMGRVNSRKRLAYAQSIGCDSADGTMLTFCPSVNIVKLIAWLDELNGTAALGTIRCGRCKGRHVHALQVRSCYGVAA